jgi:hypothetical protein
MCPAYLTNSRPLLALDTEAGRERPGVRAKQGTGASPLLSD